MKKILVASDFSSCAGNAMAYAIQLAKILNVEVCVIHAIRSMEGVHNNIFNAIYIDDYYNNKREALSTWAQSYIKSEDLKNVPVSTICKVGSVNSVLTKYVIENEVELVVMGTMGGTGIPGLFGSNASSMVENTKIPLLLIPLESRFTVNPAITLATDFISDLSKEDVYALQELVKAFQSQQLTILNVIEGTDWKRNEKGETLYKNLLTGLTLDFKYIQENNSMEGIINFAIGNHTDILCVVKRHHNLVYRIFNKSTVNQVLNRSIRAILVLHE